jgi:hypothetical protein
MQKIEMRRRWSRAGKGAKGGQYLHGARIHTRRWGLATQRSSTSTNARLRLHGPVL